MDADKEPPGQNTIYSTSGSIPSASSLVRRFKNCWTICNLHSSVHFMGSIGYFGCPSILGGIQDRKIDGTSGR